MNRGGDPVSADTNTNRSPSMNDVIEAAPRAVAAQAAGAVATLTTPTDLLRIAIEGGADLDKLERLMAWQERWEKTEAEKAYNRAFAAFKAEAVTIVKNRGVTAGPLSGKKYAELFAVVNAITPYLSLHGLSAAWKLTKDDKDWIEVTCTLKHIGGHSESVSMGGPPDAGGAKNAIQARASTVTYLERYTIKAITGLSEQDEDNDGGHGAGDEWLDKVASAQTVESLKTVSKAGTAVYQRTKDLRGYEAFAAAVQSHGAKLREREASNA